MRIETGGKADGSASRRLEFASNNGIVIRGQKKCLKEMPYLQCSTAKDQGSQICIGSRSARFRRAETITMVRWAI